MSDPQDIAEATDEDKVTDADDWSGDRVGDALPGFPPDEPIGVEEDAGESLADRVAQEQPDPAVQGYDVGQLVEDVGVVDDEEQPLATEESGETLSPEESAMHIEPG